MSRSFAIVSIGTNSTRLLLADVAPAVPRIVLARSIGTRIGEGLDVAGELGAQPQARTLAAIRQLARAVRGHYVRLFAIATSALRRAANADAFAGEVRDVLGVALRVLSGEEEAAASYRGALSALEPLRGARAGVLDVGGGSSEFADGVASEPEAVLSCEIGAVRLTERVPELAGRDGPVSDDALERARDIADTALAPLRDRPRPERVAIVGGSATTAAAILRGRRGTLPDTGVTRAGMQRVLAQLGALALEERRAVPGIKAQRADILPAGIIVIDRALELLGCERAVATTADLLLGVLLQARDERR